MTAYRVKFERIGRTHNPEDIVVLDADEETLAEHIAEHASHYLRSSDYDVMVNLEERRGYIVVGMVRNAGSFTITEEKPGA